MLIFAITTAMAATVTAPDGSYAISADGWTDAGNHQLRYQRDADAIELLEAQKLGTTMPLDFLRNWHASADDRSREVDSQTFETEDGRKGGCITTRRIDGFRPVMRGVCVVALGDGTGAMTQLVTKDVVQSATLLARFRRISALAAPTKGATPGPQTTGASERIAKLVEQGYRCFVGTWNDSGAADDLRVYYNADTHDMVARFQVIDVEETTLYYLGGNVEVQDGAYFGNLDRFEGPTESSSGIHRFFAALGVQGELESGTVSKFRTVQDEKYTELRACE